ncbi:hypothetical protein ASPBRDRAFT_47129 [Aspergillus brasiliensis CBS 101740]|uniref:Zn(2)-C6 fungal-type domain-containing protein n=1 Tax=Aspergillus brasiliensis (strain CBS 101740 / IMI 381727 / IBT 21946) TaxID=767769 RepID=A0A1L9U968_ASPBC|nr:hypothetical protein ASPBRDRAFT_47129 [Aspergillus brasiliensis CBS 101740]
MEGGKDRTHRITVKTFRACYKCAIARVRCSGGSPCARCESRSLECQYPTERRSKAKTRKETQPSFTKDDTSYDESSHMAQSTWENGTDQRPSRNGEQSMPPPFHYQMTQFQLQMPMSNAPNAVSSKSSIDQDNVEPGNRHLDENGSNGQAPSAGEDISTSLNLHESTREVKKMRIPFVQSGNAGAQGLYSRIATSTEDMAEPAHRYEGLQSEGGSDSMATMPTLRNQQVPLEPRQPLLNHTTVPTIDWLPQDLANTSNNRRHSINTYRKTSGISDTSLNQTLWYPSVIPGTTSSSLVSENLSQTPSGYTSLGGTTESPTQSSHLNRRARNHSVDGAIPKPSSSRQNQDSLSLLCAASANASLQLQQADTRRQFLFPQFPETRVHAANENHNGHRHALESSTYEKIRSAFNQLCCVESLLYPKFESDHLPDAETVSSLVHLYFVHFQPVYPIFHIPTFDINLCHWLVVLALAAIGCQFAGSQEQIECAPVFHEFLRRAISVEKEKYYVDRAPVWFLQASVLNCIGLLYNCDERARLLALNTFGNLIGLVSSEKLLGRPDGSVQFSNGTMSEQRWVSWIEDEIRRRAGYLIWLLDCTIAYHFDKRPFLSLDESQAALPSHEALWEAGSPEAWEEVRGRISDQEEYSLYDAVLIMYIEKELVPDIGEFSQLLLIHALYHRMWEVGNYFRRPLSFWNPTSKKQSRHSALPSGSVWLPGIPSYSKWRNSACDCLDILHWAAGSTVTRTAGLEHPTILHLHLARIILLAPFREIRSLATSLAKEETRWREREQTLEWHYILRWVKHDQYKARLAVVHAGAMLRHARDFSSRSFHEPDAVFLATLVLWAYGSCSIPLSDMTHFHEARHGMPEKPLLIHLDRPCDDELAQLFVREGHGMKAVLTGVGDVCAPQGPEETLKAGCQILAGLSSWGVFKRFTAILGKLSEITSQP